MHRHKSNHLLFLILALFAVALVLVPTILAGPPDDKPLRGEPEKGQKDADAPQLFYYSKGKKVQLNDAGYAVAKLKDGVGAEKTDAVVPEGPLGRLAPVLKRQGLVLLNTRKAGADGLKKAIQNTDQFQFVLPVVRPARGGPKATLMILTPRIAVRFAQNMTANAVNAYLEDKGLRITKTLRGNVYQVELKEGAVTHVRLIEAANDLYQKGKASGQVLYSHPDFLRVRRRQETVDDPLYVKQWHLNNDGGSDGVEDADVDAPEAWALTTGSPAIRIAIMDDGIQVTHPDLKDNYKNKGRYYDGAFSFDNDPEPRDGYDKHGTPCAGVAVAVANTIGGRGGAPGCELIAVHMIYATDSQAADAFRFCADPDDDPATDDGAAVISCSWSETEVAEDVEIAINEVATEGRDGKGILVLFAAGNDYGDIEDNQAYATLESVICVGSTNWRDDRPSYSNTGPELDITASSDDWDDGNALKIHTTDNTDDQPKLPDYTYSGYADGDYALFGGTSSATPLAAAVCGLILSANPNLTASQVRSILEHTADRILGDSNEAAYDPTTSHDVQYGYGRVSAKSAVAVAQASTTNADAVWPDHVLDLAVAAGESGNDLTWSNPADDVAGVLVIRSSAPIEWKPHDGDRFEVGDLVADDEAVVIGTDNVEALTDAGASSPAYYAVFAYNGDYLYAWGSTGEPEAAVAPEDPAPVEGGG